MTECVRQGKNWQNQKNLARKGLGSFGFWMVGIKEAAEQGNDGGDVAKDGIGDKIDASANDSNDDEIVDIPREQRGDDDAGV